MREKVRESLSEKAGEEENKVSRPKVRGSRKDVRDDLYSIFVDNLNPLMDLVGLWNLFKSFGKGYLSFVEVEERKSRCKVKGSQIDGGTEVPTKIAFMSWNNNKKEETWLSSCTVGILKEFSNASSVNKRLLSRGLFFFSSYLGDKCILWRFNSDLENESIIENRPCPRKIKVAYGEDSFTLRIFEDEARVDLAWLDNFMGLKNDNLNFVLEKGGVASECNKEGGDVASLSLCQW
ncbi:hypothetical protein Ddye_014119 [Dipteronia dyeriana]|uniref:Uncharacterized protein n=1 Tax=Dipteronia dyeriana TaxID=168575 RepID=A0AAD9X882_9ROSI|nr:hypothetical protein Ddye_014119 [Dipteronia dyeriana]